MPHLKELDRVHRPKWRGKDLSAGSLKRNKGDVQVHQIVVSLLAWVRIVSSREE